jgi:hypothetical protein
MKRSEAIVLGFALWAGTVGSVPAYATILTFQGGAGSLGGLPFSGGIPGIYGDHVDALLDGGVDQYDLIGNGLTPHIGAAWRMLDPITGTTSPQYSLRGAAGFGSLEFVATLGAQGLLGELMLIPDPGYAVVLNSFSLAAQFIDVTSPQTVRVLGEDLAVLWGRSVPFVPSDGQLDFAPGVFSTGAIRLQFGPGAIGLGLVNFDEQPAMSVPEPSTLLLMGIGVFASRLRRASREPH